MTASENTQPAQSKPAETRVVHVVHEPVVRSSFWDFLWNLIGLLITVAILAAVVGGLYNVLGPAGDVMALVEKTACQAEPTGCTARMSYWERRPWGHLYNLSTPRTAKTIECRRSSYIYGEWSCAETTSVEMPFGAPNPAVTVVAPPAPKPPTRLPLKALASPTGSPGRTEVPPL